MPLPLSLPRARPGRRATLIALLSATLASALPGTYAQAANAWPDKPIKVIVPYTPGGATDTVTRIVMDKLSERLGQNIIIENRPGAN
ncbi:MAG TPA: tripartite tricarboxylate transporter substrate binding protein, partial [Bordetella sp.]|nr:tripartite tricarboxylate transporter substrate binding protein [Bordetella sp.]